tara:strand:- start:640 stop:819 length:180 start_codon:yes stop_codon:yes gene_type:complete
MELHEVLILIIATGGTVLIPAGIAVMEHGYYRLWGYLCIAYGTLCGLVAVAGWINLIFY